MVNRFRFGWLAGLAMVLALPTLGNGQDISLAAGGADPIWKGTQPNQGAGFWLDQGAVGNGGFAPRPHCRRARHCEHPGTVFVLFGGPEVTGEILLSQAQVIITSSEAGNRFGASTAAGNILNLEGTISRNLVIGAPGALGNRGAVYLMAAGFEAGTSTTDGECDAPDLGAPGDQLGTALATGDLDSDGYREIIIGAPGNNRIYVIKGGPSLSGTMDLSVTAAAQTYSAPGIGRVLTSGDITGDNIYDVVAGAPTQNVTYIFAGAAGSIPAIATSAYFGIDAGDEAGTTVRILDLDADGLRDLVITAPGGDGPLNDRANAGEAYVFLGPLAAGAQHARVIANVALLRRRSRRCGSATGSPPATSTATCRTTSSCSDRAAVGGAGQLEIYYGRPRGSHRRAAARSAPVRRLRQRRSGQPQGLRRSGRRPDDIRTGVRSHRRRCTRHHRRRRRRGQRRRQAVLRDLAEDAGHTDDRVARRQRRRQRDLARPRFRSSTRARCSSAGRQQSNKPWLSTSPTAGSADSTHPSSFLITGASQGLTPGVHTGIVTVSSTSADLEQAIAVDVTMTVTGTRMALDTPVHGYQVGDHLHRPGLGARRRRRIGHGRERSAGLRVSRIRVPVRPAPRSVRPPTAAPGRMSAPPSARGSPTPPTASRSHSRRGPTRSRSSQRARSSNRFMLVEVGRDCRRERHAEPQPGSGTGRDRTRSNADDDAAAAATADPEVARPPTRGWRSIAPACRSARSPAPTVFAARRSRRR